MTRPLTDNKQKKYLFLQPGGGVSSVGLERLLDRQEVTGSIPVRPTEEKAYSLIYKVFMPFLFSLENNGLSVRCVKDE